MRCVTVRAPSFVTSSSGRPPRCSRQNIDASNRAVDFKAIEHIIRKHRHFPVPYNHICICVDNRRASIVILITCLDRVSDAQCRSFLHVFDDCYPLAHLFTMQHEHPECTASYTSAQGGEPAILRPFSGLCSFKCFLLQNPWHSDLYRGGRTDRQRE